MLDRAYRTAMPYLSIAEMFNKDVSEFMAGKDFPADLGWLAPIGTWSCVITPDEEGVQGYSVSGIGNQGIFFRERRRWNGQHFANIGHAAQADDDARLRVPARHAACSFAPRWVHSPPARATPTTSSRSIRG